MSESQPYRAGSRTTFTAVRLAAQRELSLVSFLELAKELTGSLDRYWIMDLGLFHIMGQLGVSRGVFWMVPDDGPSPLVLARAHNVKNLTARTMGAVCGDVILDTLAAAHNGVLASDLASHCGTGGALFQETGLAFFAPVYSQGEVVGVVGLGERLGGHSFGQDERRLVEGSLDVLAVALENTRLYNSLVEQHRQLRMTNEHLKELDNLKSEFLRNVNHELRTPTTIMISYLSFLLQDDSDAERRREFLEKIFSEGTKLQGLLEQLLDFSQLSQDAFAVHCREGDLNQALESYQLDRAPGVAAGFRQLSLRINEHLPRMEFDRAALVKILDTLVDNAIKFTPPGSKIDIKAETHDDRVVVSVTDDGPGIPREQQAALFDAFRQGDGSSTRRVGGMGMGLAYARRLAEVMQASLELESEPGRGCTFMVRFRDAA